MFEEKKSIHFLTSNMCILSILSMIIQSNNEHNIYGMNSQSHTCKMLSRQQKKNYKRIERMNFRVCGNVNWSRRRSTVNYGHRISPPPLSLSSEIVSTLLPTLFSSFLVCVSFSVQSHVTPRRLPPNQTHTGALVRGAQQPTPGFLNVKLPFFFSFSKFKEKKEKVFFFFSNESVLFLFCFFRRDFQHVAFMSAEMPRLDLRKECKRDYPTVEYAGLSSFSWKNSIAKRVFFYFF